MVTPIDEENVNSSDTMASSLEAARVELGLNKKEAAEQLEVSYSAYRNWESGRSTPDHGYDTVIRHLKAGDSLASSTGSDNGHGDPIYDTPAQAGDGSMDFTEEPVGHMPPSQSLSSTGRDVYWMPVIGDSMGERYKKHTLVPVVKFHDPVDDFAADDVYVIKLDEAIKIKRLQRLPGRRVRIISDSDAYPNEIIELDDNLDFKILGRVLV